ncbi:pseudaminic acid cytidylyltransferase [Oceanospirillum sediminis]|uniref:Pseudaminic acid cytidylyltransferase n=1 Tax=Oceanospirillum sediminis TaxID=2760088 RepID=A0A839IMX7_9GAMM|nr:pseudaminic acid cytidylyltransferase [Oceanospirillum sediminis]MBB1485646.1 pseudaminic acid cytidylyltransferase [Oceanospirillum sediminis]
MRVCVIPARGGSKRIPRKNVKLFLGRPMIAWSIDVAIKSDCFDRIVVSTDDDEIAQVAIGCGAEVPFIRPASLSDDYAGTVEVLAHAAEALLLRPEDVVCCLYATAPFVREEDLQAGHKKLLQSDLDYVVSVVEYNYPIQRALRFVGGRLSMFDSEMYGVRSQDLEGAWHDAGQFYWGNAEAWMQRKPVLNALSGGVILPSYRVQDIDTPDDWVRAELMFRMLRSDVLSDGVC